MSFITPPATGYVGTLSKVSGYRPIEITLLFKDGTKAVPDSLGSPRTGSAYFVGPEILKEINQTATVTTSTLPTQTVGSNSTSVVQSTLSYKVYKTSQVPILWGPNGVSLKCFWHDPTLAIPDVTDIPIQPDRVIVDSKQGFVEVRETAPTTQSQLICYYYSVITELTPRISETLWKALTASTEAGLVGFSTSVGLSQVYPVTRNKTDYRQNSVIQLKIPNFDKNSPDYYPVYEYVVRPGGVIEFAQPLLSDISIDKIQVRYKSLNIQPRILVDIIKSDITTYVSPIQLDVITC